MIAKFTGKRISSILGILPEKEVYFEDEISNYNFPEKQTLRLKKVMGFEKHRLAKDTTTVYDLALEGVNYILDNSWVNKEEIGAIIVVTLCPDYFVPHISNMIQGAAGFRHDVLCMDIAQGCCGYIMGLFQAFMILDHMADKKILLINGDVLSHKISQKDRNAFPIMGDGASITIVENTEDKEPIYVVINSDGANSDSIKIPAGGFRMPSSAQTGVMKDAGDGNIRALDHFVMDGNEVFNFMQTKVPPLIESLLGLSGVALDNVDYFLFHQPNKFMLKKLCQKIGIPEEKMPMNLVESIGNTSGSTIPLTTVLNLKEKLKYDAYKCCMAGFGSGLCWGGTIMNLGNLEFCNEIITSL